jgi:hypothetical protein
MKNNKPVIKIYYSSEIKDISKINPILWGIEEEGVPYNIEYADETDGVCLAYMAAKASALNTGLGIGADGTVVLHYDKLDENHPLFRSNILHNKLHLKIIGENAARLVKGLPFKDLQMV